MDKLPIDLGSLPEPVKSMLENLDPEVIKNMISMYDPATLSMMMNSMFSMMQDKIPPDQMNSLKEMLDSLIKMIPQR